VGSSGPDVRALQQFLNAKGFTVATAGPGSRGSETASFGPATERALGLFQASQSITPPAGYFGPTTMRRVNSSLGQIAASCPVAVTPTVSQGAVVTTTGSAFTRDLQLGDTGNDVKALQIYLNSHSFPVSTQGPGSKGYETTRFGPATARALSLFQAAHALPSTGYFGPRTRGVIK
jgi:peptidoglycan hydrolase-like protein with peptidoglycan-binding domain